MLPVLRRAVAALLLSAPVHPSAAHATAAERFQGAPVAGTVVDQRTVPIVGARVSIEGTTRATTTDARGAFRLDNVPGTQVTLRVTMVGFKPVSVTTQPGKTDLQVQLSPSIFELTEVVVTGTAGGEEKRALGNAVAKVQAAEIQAIAPAADITGLINGRASNVVFQATAGAVGSGGKLRIRGSSSLSLNNQPLLYIDGVRSDATNNTAFSFSSSNRLNDIDPSTIESIEIIKGPAAATLYGTEASNGVIQIITKKGTQGRSQISFETSQGADWIWNPEGLFDKTLSYYKDASGAIKTLNLVRMESDSGRPIFQTGRLQRYGMDIRGGNAGIQYYFAGTYDDEEGPVNPNALQRWSGRANLNAAVTNRLSISINAGYVSSKNTIPHYELMRGPYSPMPAFLPLPQRGWLTYPPEVTRQAFGRFEDVGRTTGGIQFNHSPFSWLSHRLTVGVDDLNEGNDETNYFLTGFAALFFTATDAQGRKVLTNRGITTTTVDYSATGAAKLSDGKIELKTSVGAQFYRRFQKLEQLTGTGFPAPGVTTISSAAVRTATETSIENRTFGVYVQEQIGLKNRFFLTGAVRADDNSAFGSEFDLVTYPKVSASWMVSDEPFWNKSLLSTLRLRGAYGKSGQQPDQFAALRSYQAVVGPNNTPAVRPQFIGNPSLGPERGVELELGFEAGLFNDRLGFDVTYFDKKTKDAILARNVAPSEGFGLGQQFVNIGQVLNKGIELQVTGSPVAKKNFKLDLAFSLSHTKNKIVDMGDVGDITGVGINQVHRAGFPVAAFFWKRVVSAELGANGQPTNIMCDAGTPEGNPGGATVPCAQAPAIYTGQPLPNWEGSFNTTIDLWNRLTLSGLVDFKTGGRNFSADLAIQCAILRLCQPNVDPASDVLSAADMTVNTFGIYSTPEVRFAKIRQISASYRMPERWARYVGGSSAALTVAARNVHTFTNFKLGPDPELGNVYNGAQHNQEAFQQVPMPFQFLTTIRVTF